MLKKNECDFIQLKDLKDALDLLELKIPGYNVRLLEEQFKKENSDSEKLSLTDLENVSFKLIFKKISNNK